MENNCELYKYNQYFYAIKKENIAYFASDFLEAELDADHLCWLNVHGLSNKEGNWQLCIKLNNENISNENIFINQRKP